MQIDSVKHSHTERVYFIKCACGRTIRHSGSRWRVTCDCGKTERLTVLREQVKPKKRR